jgi:hypothetical protein
VAALGREQKLAGSDSSVGSTEVHQVLWRNPEVAAIPFQFPPKASGPTAGSTLGPTLRTCFAPMRSSAGGAVNHRAEKLAGQLIAGP